MGALLPAGYEALEPFVADWALPTSMARAQARNDSTAEAREAFFAAAAPLLESGLAELDTRTLAQLDDTEKRLLDLFLSLAHVGMAVDVHGTDEPKHAALRAHLAITRSTADAAA